MAEFISMLTVAQVPGTLLRISAIRGRDEARTVIGLTYRIGRHIPGVLNTSVQSFDQ